MRFDCTGLHSGIYVDGCSNVYWFCHSGTASLSKCPKNLYFNIKKLRVSFGFHINSHLMFLKFCLNYFNIRAEKSLNFHNFTV